MRRLHPILCLVVVAAGCAGPQYRTVTIPPRIDLAQHEIIAVVEFDASKEGELGPLATRRFTDLVRRDQGLVRMLAVQPESDRRDGRAMQALGRSYGARSVLVGSIAVSDIRPNLNIASSFRSGRLSATVDATLSVDLVETETGASIWSASSRASRTIGQVSLFDGKNFTFDAEDPEQAYGPLIDALVSEVAMDFQATTVRQRIPR